MSAQPNFQQEKVKLNHEKNKTNGKWESMKEAAHHDEKAVTDKAEVVAPQSEAIIAAAKYQASNLLKAGGDFAKSSGEKAVKLAKAYPVQTAAGAVAIGLYLGSRIFG